MKGKWSAIRKRILLFLGFQLLIAMNCFGINFMFDHPQQVNPLNFSFFATLIVAYLYFYTSALHNSL